MSKIKSKDYVFAICVGAISTLIGTGAYYKYSDAILSVFGIVEYLLLFGGLVFILGLITLIRTMVIPKSYTYGDIVKIIGDVEKYKETLNKQIEKMKEATKIMKI